MEIGDDKPNVTQISQRCRVKKQLSKSNSAIGPSYLAIWILIKGSQLASAVSLSFIFCVVGWPNANSHICSKTPVLGIWSIFCALQLLAKITEEYELLNIRNWNENL